jgi:hypothetical protein
VTGYSVTTANEYVAILSGDGSVGRGFMFIRVPERKTAKNRMHIDLGTPDLEAETERVLGLNEFCIGLHDAPQH